MAAMAALILSESILKKKEIAPYTAISVEKISHMSYLIFFHCILFNC